MSGRWWRSWEPRGCTTHSAWTRSSATSLGALAAVEAVFPDLWARVWQAERWCQRARTPRDLWSPALDPGLLDAHGAIPTAPPLPDAEARVEALVSRRRALLGAEASDAASGASRPPLGGICWYVPEEELCDGAAQVASDLLFNAHNVPGWDTWLVLRHLPRALAIQIGADPGGAGPAAQIWILLAWISGPLLAQAAEGIGANPERCIGWLEDPRRG